ncbi:S-type pyocin domain-containing protein [Pseudomonas uvaldensis]|uniref:S-type pyocin domain-containing protein n=1 Tax=Pseudomonas uvaldensis TaxID=2878385 RepID=UPI001E48546D|nr:S-type pyocin domain-containing protein [Pseudomonas uvaldensis]MCE0461299.1 S-type pyocin domain-containing protein [Pseudomonas uvaldensis]
MPQEKNILINRGIPRKPSSSFGFGFSARGVLGPDHADRAYDAVDYAFEWLEESNESVEKCFKENIKNITYITDAELAKTRATARSAIPTAASGFDIELRALNLLLSKARADHQQQIKTANLYYGHDPLTHKARDPAYKGFELVGRRGGQRGYYSAIAKWNVSYAAAYQAKFLAEQIKLLESRLAIQNKAIAEAKAKSAAAQAKAQAEAKRAAERARLAAETQRLAAAAAAHAKAQAEAKRAAEEQARKAVEAEVQRAAHAQTKRPVLAGRTFPLPGAATAVGPVFAISGSTLAISPATTLAIQAALRSTVSAIVEVVAATAGPAVGGIAALLYPSELGNSDLYALSVPLSELAPDNTDDLHLVATSTREMTLPVVLGSRTVADKTEFVVAAPSRVSKHSRVPVRLATLDAQANTYKSYLPNADIGMTWTPIVTPGDASTALPASVSNATIYDGATPVAGNGRIDSHPELDRYSFGGFVTVFPADSGIPPLYTVFSSPYEGATTTGEHSGRRFNPEQAGGPILELDWRTATITPKGIEEVKLHIARLDQSDANIVMIDRLERIQKGQLTVTDVDKRFYTHEIRELERFRALGLTDSFNPGDDSVEWNNAHTATLEDYKLDSKESSLYSPEALTAANKQMEAIYKRLLKGEL